MGKRVKKSSAKGSENAPLTADEVKKMVDKCISDSKELNLILRLLEAMGNHENYDVTVLVIHGLLAVFMKFIQKGSMIMNKNLPEDAPQNLAISWIRGNYTNYVNRLLSCQTSSIPKIRIAAVRALFDLIKVESIVGTKNDPESNYYFDNAMLLKVLEALCKVDYSEFISDKEVGENALEMTISLYINEYDDVRYFVYKNIPKLCAQAETEVFVKNLFTLMMDLEVVPDDEDNMTILVETVEKSAPCFQIKSHKRVFSEAWLAFLRLSLTEDMFRDILALTQDKIVPNMSDPRLLHGFLTESYNLGGVASLLSLHSLFILITKYNLDYPQFYPKLYNVLDVSCLNAPNKHRAKFLKLMDMFMKSTHLPSNLVAAFLKKMARICLESGPGGILGVLPIMHNLIRRHQTCVTLLHKELVMLGEDDGKEVDQKVFLDPFDLGETEPENSRASESCLWELLALRDHYNPVVADYVKKFQTPFEKKQIQQDVEKYLNESYDSLISTYEDKKPRESTKLAYEKPTNGMFVDGGLVQKHWIV